MKQTKCNNVAHANKHRPNENEKVLVISFSNTCSNPEAMVVQPLNAALASPTVNRPWRLDYVTCFTMLQNCEPSIYYIIVASHTLLTLSIINTFLMRLPKKLLKILKLVISRNQNLLYSELLPDPS